VIQPHLPGVLVQFDPVKQDATKDDHEKRITQQPAEPVGDDTYTSIYSVIIDRKNRQQCALYDDQNDRDLGDIGDGSVIGLSSISSELYEKSVTSEGEAYARHNTGKDETERQVETWAR